MAWGNNENKLKACQSCRALIPANAASCEMCGAAGHHADYAGSLADSLAVLGDWPVTMILMTVNIAVYAWVLIYQMQFAVEGKGFQFEPIYSPDVLGAFGSVSTSRVRRGGEWWRLLSYAFLHGGVLHIGMNTYGMLQAGRMAEELWGRTQYFVLYVLSGIGGGLMVIVASKSVSAGTVGASGALFGVIAGLWAHTYRRDSVLGKGFQQFMLVWLLFGVAMSFSPRVSWQGHLGGALVGATLSLLLPAESVFRQNLRRVRLTQVAAALCLVAVLVTFGMMTRNLGKARQSFALVEVSQTLLNLTDNLRERDRLQLLAALTHKDGILKPEEVEGFTSNFVKAFGDTPDKISPDKINQTLTQAHAAVCSDIGTLERMRVLDAEIGQIQERMRAALQPGCAKAAATVNDLKNVAALRSDTDKNNFNAAFADYWHWVEKRAAQSHQTVEDILPKPWVSFAQGYLKRNMPDQSSEPRNDKTGPTPAR